MVTTNGIWVIKGGYFKEWHTVLVSLAVHFVSHGSVPRLKFLQLIIALLRGVIILQMMILQPSMI